MRYKCKTKYKRLKQKDELTLLNDSLYDRTVIVHFSASTDSLQTPEKEKGKVWLLIGSNCILNLGIHGFTLGFRKFGPTLYYYLNI